MKKIFSILILLAVMLTLGLTSCTENQRAKSWGGTADVDVEPGQKVVVVTRKDSDLWVLTRKMRADEKPETYNFFEKSSWGLLQGNYIIKESR